MYGQFCFLVEMSESVIRVGDDGNETARCVRVVHISDTHMRHDSYLNLLPEGDILIHTGDFTSVTWRRHFDRHDLNKSIDLIDTFFEKLSGFKHKILVAGNHEISFSSKNKQYIMDNLKHVTYLQDSGVKVLGLNIYGSPWNAKRWTSHANGFARSWGHFEHRWDSIPVDTDILATHMPPNGILDLAQKKLKFLDIFSASGGLCQTCTETHSDHEHWGCRRLRQTVQEKIK